MRALFFATVLLSTAIVVAAREAAACSCAEPSLTRALVPADGTVGFPIDGKIRLLLEGGWPAALVARLAEEYRLVDERGAAVPLRASADRTLVTLAPSAPLAPRSRYRVERVFAYDGDGLRVDDDTRLRAALGWRNGGKRVATRRYFAESTFTTGEGREAGAPPTPTAVAPTVTVRQGGGDCGPGSAVAVRYAVEGLRPGDLLALEQKGRGVLDWFRHVPTRPLAYAGDLRCTPNRVHVDGAPLEFRIVVVSATDRRAASPFVTAAAPEPLRHGGDDEPLSIGTWLEPPLDTRSLQLQPSPAGCASLRVVASRAEKGTWPWMSGQQSSLAADGAVVVHHRDDSALVRGSVETPLAVGSSAVAAFTPSGDAIVAGTLYQQGRVLGVASYPKGASAPAWLRRLSTDGADVNSDARVAVSADRALVAWQAQALYGATGAPRVRWAMVRLADGKPIGTEGAIEGESERIAVALDGKEGWLAYLDHRRDRGSALVAIRSDGQPGRRIALPDGLTGVDIAIDDKGPAVVTALGGLLLLQRYDRAGGVRGAPLKIPSGSREVYAPRVAVNGALTLVVWESKQRQVVAVAVDAQGNQSAPRTLGGGRHTTMPAIAALSDGGFLVGFGDEMAGVGAATPLVETIVCDGRPAMGAPVQLPR